MAADAPTPEFYMRPLPGCCVDLTTAEGQGVFSAALREGNTSPFFSLVAQFRTQDEPAYCGLASLTMALNALKVDPGKRWNGVWRWYSEASLSCCKPLEEVKQEGISLEQLACLARCNSLHADEVTLTPVPEADRTAAHAAAAVAAAGRKEGIDGTVQWLLQDGAAFGQYMDVQELERFRATIAATFASPPPLTTSLIANYARAGLDQTGTGHFSPLGAYCAAADAVLVLDTARFKYPPHWVSLPRLAAAVATVTGDGSVRGMLAVRRMAAAPIILFEVAATLKGGVLAVGGGCSTGACGSSGTWSSLLLTAQQELSAVLQGAAEDCMAKMAPAACDCVSPLASATALAPAAVAAAVARMTATATAQADGPMALCSAASATCPTGAALSSAGGMKLSPVQAAEAAALLQQVEGTQVFKWVSAALPRSAVTPIEGGGGGAGLAVSKAHSLTILLLAVVAPPPEGEGKGAVPFKPCCSTAVDAWRGMQTLVARDIADSGEGVLGSEVAMLQAQLSAVQLPSSAAAAPA